MRKNDFCTGVRFRAVGVDAHIDPQENARFMVVFRRIREIAVPRRRGGRPCPPAGNACFYGNPMRIRNILKGRCGHRPLQPTTQDFTILRADRVVRPYKRPRKTQRFSVSRRRGRCPHRPAGNACFYGKPMQIHNILMGRCGHRPLQTTTKIQLILRADRVVRPYKCA